MGQPCCSLGIWVPLYTDRSLTWYLRSPGGMFVIHELISYSLHKQLLSRTLKAQGCCDERGSQAGCWKRTRGGRKRLCEHLSSLAEGTDVNQHGAKSSVEGTVKAGTWAELLVVVPNLILLASNSVDLPSPA